MGTIDLLVVDREALEVNDAVKIGTLAPELVLIESHGGDRNVAEFPVPVSDSFSVGVAATKQGWISEVTLLG